MGLSVIIITRNEQSNIAACLESVAFADECIVVDYASADNTAAIAREHGAQVFSTADWPGFGPQKNRALSHATQEWVLSLDADERVPPELAQAIQNVVRSNRAKVAYCMPRRTAFCGQWIRHCGWTPDYVLRLFRRTSASFTDQAVHERLVLCEPGAVIESLDVPLEHYSYPSVDAYWDKLARYAMAWASEQHQQGRRTSILRAIAAGCFAFVRSYILRLGFLDGAMGFVVCTMQAQAAFGKYINLYCLQRSKEKS